MAKLRFEPKSVLFLSLPSEAYSINKTRARKRVTGI